MRFSFLLLALLGATAGAPAVGAPADNDVVSAISLSDLADFLSTQGLPSQVAAIQGTPIVVTDLNPLKVDATLRISGLNCGSDIVGKDAATPCHILEFASVLEISTDVTDAEIAKIDELFELASVERLDPTRVVISDGMVLSGGVAAANIGANVGFFGGQIKAAMEALKKAAGRTS